MENSRLGEGSLPENGLGSLVCAYIAMVEIESLISCAIMFAIAIGLARVGEKSIPLL